VGVRRVLCVRERPPKTSRDNLHYVDLTLDSSDLFKSNEWQFHIMTYLNYTSDQFTGLGGLVIPGTIRDSVYVLEALLEQESGLTPTEIMSDTAS